MTVPEILKFLMWYTVVNITQPVGTASEEQGFVMMQHVRYMTKLWDLTFIVKTVLQKMYVVILQLNYTLQDIKCLYLLCDWGMFLAHM
jgi:hypothetical protein